MSGTLMFLTWSVIVDDTDKWSFDMLAKAEKDGTTDYDEFAISQLRAAMENAGNEFIENNPDMFRGGLV